MREKTEEKPETPQKTPPKLPCTLHHGQSPLIRKLDWFLTLKFQVLEQGRVATIE
jgi:hypothetical protein